MFKDDFFSNEHIKSYLVDLDKKLSSLPTNIKQQYLDEIKSDLFELALEKDKNGVKQDKIPLEVLREFISAKQLANEILLEHENDGNKKELKKMTYPTVITISSLGALSVPIGLGFINFSALLPFLLGFIFGNIWIFLNKANWNEKVLLHFGKIIGSFNWIIAIAFALFSLRIILTKNINLFSLLYLIGYLLVVFVYFKIFKSFQRKIS